MMRASLDPRIDVKREAMDASEHSHERVSTPPAAGHSVAGAALGEDDGAQPFTHLLLSAGAFESFLCALVSYARSQTGHLCSITVRSEDRAPYTFVASDDLALQLDEQQYHGDRGPCLEALSTGVPVVSTEMRTETRWNPYSARAAELGARSVLAHPLIVGETTIGALNLYGLQPWSPEVRLQARAAQLAERAAGALAVGLRMSAGPASSADLELALTSRSVIDQAIGILIAQQRCSPEEAFALLRQASQESSVKLRDLAAQLVSAAQRPSHSSAAATGTK